MNHTIVISDVHLCESVPGDDVWMRYRQRRFSPDEDLGQLFELLGAEVRDGTLTVVFNGDVFDFDAPAVVDGRVDVDGPSPAESAAANVLERILREHPRFVNGLTDLMIQGHRVVFVSGNHDAHIGWPAVRERLAEHLVTSARTRGATRDVSSLAAQIVFRAWFYRSPDAIHVEHGHQYDHYCSFRHPMEPFTPDGVRVQPTMGSLSFRHLVSRMGYFNPHVDSSFMLSARQYLTHWARYYARSPHSLATTWARGAVKVMRELLGHRLPTDADGFARATERSAFETGAPTDALIEHASLFAPPVNEHAHRAMRELWLDRFAFAGAGLAAVGVAAIAGVGPASIAALGSAAAIAAYETFLPKPTLDDTYVHTARCQREIARIHSARAVVLGHTHQAFARWDAGVFHGNCGTWSPAYHDAECTLPLTGGRPVIWLRTERGEMTGGLYHWRGGMLLDALRDETQRVLADAALVHA